MRHGVALGLCNNIALLISLTHGGKIFLWVNLDFCMGGKCDLVGIYLKAAYWTPSCQLCLGIMELEGEFLTAFELEHAHLIWEGPCPMVAHMFDMQKGVAMHNLGTARLDGSVVCKRQLCLLLHVPQCL